VLSVVQQIQIGEAQILVWLNRTAIVPDAAPKPTDRMAAEPLVLSIAASLRRAEKGVRLVIRGAEKVVDRSLASPIARAIAMRNKLLAGDDYSIDALAARLRVRYYTSLVSLSRNHSRDLGRRTAQRADADTHLMHLLWFLIGPSPVRLIGASSNLPFIILHANSSSTRCFCNISNRGALAAIRAVRHWAVRNF
jgi:hypothetical protein